MINALSPAQQVLAQEFFNLGAIKFGEFPIKLHGKNPSFPLSPIHLNLRTANNQKPGPLLPGILREIGLELWGCIRKAGIIYDGVAGVPHAGEPFVTALQRIADRPIPRVLLKKEDYPDGTRSVTSILEGTELAPGRILLIDDLITQAESKWEAIRVLQTAGLTVTDVLVGVDREHGARDALAKEGIVLHAIFTLSQLLNLYTASGRISVQQAKKVEAFARLARGEISEWDYQQYL